jgi:hypothetical protein
VKSTRAQQHENKRLSFSLSALDVGPLSVVPLIESTTVLLSGFTKTWPRKPSIGFSHPIGNDCEPQYEMSVTRWLTSQKRRTEVHIGSKSHQFGAPGSA